MLRKFRVLLLIIVAVPIIAFIKFYKPADPYVEARKPEADERYCRYVSTFGIKKMCMQMENCIYVKTDKLGDFVIPDKKFVLVTGYEDTTIPDDFPQKAKQILASPNLIKWFSENVTRETKKLQLIPIGLDYHSVIGGYMQVGPVESPVKQEKLILALQKKPYNERELKIYCNFLHSIEGRRYSQDRIDALQKIPADLLVYEQNFVPRADSWSNMVKYAFVLSPHGNGLDCHRTWEALALGSIPIVKSSSLDALYEGLPVLIVKDWSDVSLELLQQTIKNFKSKQFNYDKLTLAYWRDQLKSAAVEQQR